VRPIRFFFFFIHLFVFFCVCTPVTSQRHHKEVLTAGVHDEDLFAGT
jgi:hypothetical protein